MSEQISMELRILRIRNNLTLSEAASKLNITIGTLSRYENNKSPLTLEMVEKMLNLYGEDISIFFNKICANIH